RRAPGRHSCGSRIRASPACGRRSSGSTTISCPRPHFARPDDMPFLDTLAGPHSIGLFGHTLALGPSGASAAIGWALFAAGAFFAVRERMTGKSIGALSPLVAAAITLAAMSAGLGLLLGESYPDFARVFCFPYALLALAVAVLGRALHAGGRPIGGEE